MVNNGQSWYIPPLVQSILVSRAKVGRGGRVQFPIALFTGTADAGAVNNLLGLGVVDLVTQLMTNTLGKATPIPIEFHGFSWKARLFNSGFLV